MRIVKIRFCNRSDLYVRKASEDARIIEIQGQYGGVILDRPQLKRSLIKGVYFVDQETRSYWGRSFHDRSHEFEKNEYVIEHYWKQ